MVAVVSYAQIQIHGQQWHMKQLQKGTSKSLPSCALNLTFLASLVLGLYFLVLTEYSVSIKKQSRDERIRKKIVFMNSIHSLQH